MHHTPCNSLLDLRGGRNLLRELDITQLILII
jgi:hypothetical protein